MSNNKSNGSVNGKGYYIALILCAVAIGISGYMYYRNANEETQLSNNDVTAAVTLPNEEDNVEVVATQPRSTGPAVQPSEATAPTQKKPMQTASPVEGEIISVFAMDELQYNQTTRDWRVHNGMDIAAEEGAEVCAAADGEVYTVYEDETMGMTVVIRHEDGYSTTYSSLASEVLVQPGDVVTMGQSIGSVGQTALLETAIGSHVHFSVSCDGEDIDPVEFLNQE